MIARRRLFRRSIDRTLLVILATLLPIYVILMGFTLLSSLNVRDMILVVLALTVLHYRKRIDTLEAKVERLHNERERT